MNYLIQNAVVVQAQYYNYRHSHYNRQKIKGKQTNKQSHQAQIGLKSNWANSIRFPGMGIILCGSGFHPLGPWLHPESHSSSSCKLCLQLHSFINLFPACRILGVWQLSFSLSFLPLIQPKLAVFLLVWHSQKPREFPMYVSRIHS